MFRDRTEAAVLLSKKLEKYKDQDGIVLAVPRGGVPVGYIVAKELGLPLEVVLSKKIGHPRNPEFAVGSVSLYGTIINSVANVSMDYITKEADRIRNVLKEKFKLYMGDQKPADLKNKTVIIIDDGIATGSTMLATIEAIKSRRPGKIIIAVPVAPPSAIKMLSSAADEVVCLFAPENFMGVGAFYEDFSQVSDEEVIRLLWDAPHKNVRYK